MPLSIRVQFLAGYSGREWPPSPARLFKALVAAARSGWALTNRENIESALRVLEQQGWSHGTNLPDIIAPRATLRLPRHRRFVPNNSKNWPPDRRRNPEKGIDLEPEPILGWDIEAPHTVWYWWPNVDRTQVAVFRDLTRRVFSIGKGEDLAVLDASEVEPPFDGVRWKPALTGASVEVPETGCLDVCDALFARDSSDVPLPAAGVRAAPYESNIASSFAFAPAFVLALRRAGKTCSWDARLLRQIVGPIRDLLRDLCDEIVSLLAGSRMDGSEREALVRRVLLGCDEVKKPIAEPHLAILPLPSVLGPYPDGRVRRVALVGFGCEVDPNRRAVIELAQVLLNGRELYHEGRGTGIVLDTEHDGQWLRGITRRSRTWVTLTPMVQAAKELTSSEWKLLTAARRAADQHPAAVVRLETRLRTRRIELVERSLRQAVAEEAQILSIEVGSAGPIAGVHVANQYRTSGYISETPRLHVCVTFDRPVAGPLAIGRGRHVGFGVLWPTEQAERIDRFTT